ASSSPLPQPVIAGPDPAIHAIAAATEVASTGCAHREATAGWATPPMMRQGMKRDETRSLHKIVWPVFFQSARKASSPLSVSGCLTRLLSTAGGTVATSAPAIAASLTWFGVRIDAARISVESAG